MTEEDARKMAGTLAVSFGKLHFMYFRRFTSISCS